MMNATESSAGSAAAGSRSEPLTGSFSEFSSVSFSELSTLRPHLLRSAAFLLPAGFCLVLLSVGMGFSVLAGLSVVGGGGGRPIIGPEAASGLTLLGLGGLVVVGGAWFASLFASVRETLGEGSGRIEDAAGDAVAVRDRLRGHLERRCPSWKLLVETLDGHPALVANDGDGTSAVIVARAVGPDLRISWTVSRRRSTSTLILDQFPGKRGAEMQLLDTDAAAAMAGYLGGAVEHVVRSPAS